jgi:hypothetical protein
VGNISGNLRDEMREDRSKEKKMSSPDYQIDSPQSNPSPFRQRRDGWLALVRRTVDLAALILR